MARALYTMAGATMAGMPGAERSRRLVAWRRRLEGRRRVHDLEVPLCRGARGGARAPGAQTYVIAAPADPDGVLDEAVTVEGRWRLAHALLGHAVGQRAVPGRDGAGAPGGAARAAGCWSWAAAWGRRRWGRCWRRGRRGAGRGKGRLAGRGAGSSSPRTSSRRRWPTAATTSCATPDACCGRSWRTGAPRGGGRRSSAPGPSTWCWRGRALRAGGRGAPAGPGAPAGSRGRRAVAGGAGAGDQRPLRRGGRERSWVRGMVEAERDWPAGAGRARVRLHFLRPAPEGPPQGGQARGRACPRRRRGAQRKRRLRMWINPQGALTSLR